MQGVIVAAIVFPIKMVIDKLWEMSNEPPKPEVWLTWSGLKILLFGKMAWRFQTPQRALAPPVWKRHVARVGRDPIDLLIEVVALLGAWAANFLLCAFPRLFNPACPRNPSGGELSSCLLVRSLPDGPSLTLHKKTLHH